MVETSRKKRILFLATRELSYPRVAMTLEGLRAVAEVDVIACDGGSYMRRIPSLAWRFAWRRKSGYDLVFVAFFAQPILPWVRLFWRGPVLADAFISLYDSLVLDKGLSESGSGIARLSLWLDRYLLKSSQVALVDTWEHRRLFEEIGRSGRLPIFKRLWASAQEDVFAPLEPLTYEGGAGDVFEVLFWGGFIPLQGVDVIVKAATLLDPEQVRITIVGTGQTFENCRQLADTLETHNLEFVGWQTPEQLRERARRSHLLLGIFGATEKAKRVIPNKAFQALALGKPLLTARSEGVAELLSDGRDVMLCEPGDVRSLAEGIEQARSDYGAAIEIGRRGRETFEAEASRSKCIQILGEALDCFEV